MDPCLFTRRLEICCEKERGAWWKHGQWRHMRGEGAPSALVCLPCTRCSFWRPLILSGACYAGNTNPKLHWPCWILWLGLCSDMPLLILVRQTQECLISWQYNQTWSFVLLMLFCDHFCLSFQWESCSIFKVIEQCLHLSQNQGISFASWKMWHPFHSGWTKSITLSSHNGSLSA